MPAVQFDRGALAKWYATQHFKTDPGLRRVYHLPLNAPEREIRLVEINDLIAERDDVLEPIDFGVDPGEDSQHTLVVLDVTPRQWEQIGRDQRQLPPGWSIDDAELLCDDAHE